MRYWHGSLVLLIALAGVSVADNRSDQMNPNNDAYWDSRGYDGRPDDWESFSGSDDRDFYYQNNNRSNQLNPNNDAYWDSRGDEYSAPDWDSSSFAVHIYDETISQKSDSVPEIGVDWQVSEFLETTPGEKPPTRLPEIHRVSFDFYEHHNKVISRLHTPDSYIQWDRFSTNRFSNNSFSGLPAGKPMDDKYCVSTMVYAGTRLTAYTSRYGVDRKCSNSVGGLGIELSKSEKKLSKKELINRIWREIPGIGYMPPTDNVNLSLRDNDKPAFYVAKSKGVMLLDSKKGVIYIAESQSDVEKIAALEVESAAFDWLSLWK